MPCILAKLKNRNKFNLLTELVEMIYKFPQPVLKKLSKND